MTDGPWTTEDVRGFARGYDGSGLPEAEFDAWLAVHDAEVKAEALKTVTDRVRELHHPVDVEPSDTICGHCSWQLPNGRFFGKVIEWPCPDVALLDQLVAEMDFKR